MNDSLDYRRLLRLAAHVCWTIFAMPVAWGSACAADLEVEVHGVRPQSGQVRAAVFDSAESFALDIEVRAMVSASGEIHAGIFTDEDQFPRHPARLATVAASARTLRIAFADLEPGVYAVGVYQDRNDNSRLDTTVVRNATEPWGISNNSRPKDRSPTWDEAKFTLPPEGTHIVIELH